MKIIKYKKLANNKYKILLEDGSIIEVCDQVIIDNNLLYRKEINEKVLDKIKEESKYLEIYNACVKYIVVRVRSCKEIKDYLERKGISNDIIESVVRNLKEKNFLNDEYFTECYIKDKLALTSWGEFKIKNNLINLGIDNNIINKYNYLFAGDRQRDKIKKIIKKSIKANHKDNINLKNKVYVKLMNLGYSKELILEELNNNFE